MNESMNQLISIFSDIIMQNDYITFAYSSLHNRWFCLSMRGADEYDCVETIDDLNDAYEKMLEECQYYWLNKNRLVDPDLTTDATIQALTPEIPEVSKRFMEPYVTAAEKLL